MSIKKFCFENRLLRIGKSLFFINLKTTSQICIQFCKYNRLSITYQRTQSRYFKQLIRKKVSVHSAEKCDKMQVRHDDDDDK